MARSTLYQAKPYRAKASNLRRCSRGKQSRKLLAFARYGLLDDLGLTTFEKHLGRPQRSGRFLRQLLRLCRSEQIRIGDDRIHAVQIARRFRAESLAEQQQFGGAVSTHERRQQDAPTRLPGTNPRSRRSEEHTSELQSRLHLVCRLLLEKKKQVNGTT